MSSTKFLNPENKWPFVIVFLGVLLLYSISLGYGFFVYDDLVYIKLNPKIINFTFSNFTSFWRDANTKSPLFFNFLQLINIIWTTKSASIFRLINILFHAFNALLVYDISFYLFKKLFKETSIISREVFQLSAVASALVFSFHPTQIESVVWVYSMRGVIATFFGLLSFRTYLLNLEKNNPINLFMALFFFCVGMMFKFSIATLPVCFVLIDYFLISQLTFKESLLKHWLALALGLFFYYVFSYEYVSNYVVTLKLNYNDLGFIMLRTSMFYLKRLFLPLGYSLDYGLNHNNFKNFLPHVWLTRFGLFLVIVMNIYSVRSLLKNEKYFFIFLYLTFLAIMFPGLGLVPQDFQYVSFVSDRYLYWGVFPFGLLVGYLLLLLHKKRPELSRPMTITLLMIYFGLSFNLITKWKNQEDILSNCYRENKSSQICFEGLLTLANTNYKREKARQIIWDNTREAKASRESFKSFVIYLGQNKLVSVGLKLIENWEKQKLDFGDILRFHLFIEAKMPSYAEIELKKIHNLNPQVLSDNKVDFRLLTQLLAKVKSENAEVFQPWVQMTSAKYKPLSEQLKLEMMKRNLPVDN